MDTREPRNPPVQGGEYPKMLYRDGLGADHCLAVDTETPMPLLVDGKFSVDTLVVNDLDEELVALADGWRLTADPNGVGVREDARDAEIRRLREQLEASNRIEDGQPKRRGRPPMNREAFDGDAA